SRGCSCRGTSSNRDRGDADASACASNRCDCSSPSFTSEGWRSEMPYGTTSDKKVVLAPVSGIYVHWRSAGVEIAHLKSKAEWTAHSHIKACAELQNASCTAGRPRIVAAEFKHRGRAEM